MTIKNEMNVYQKLLEVQKEAHAPRDINGKFGKARSAEQILEAYKPVCNEHGLYIHTTDIVERVGDRNYITVNAIAINVDKPEEQVSASASAWENEVEVNKYGSAILDTSQVSGKTGSYAKKYALQNLFAIDDTKDADQEEPKPVKKKEEFVTATQKQLIMELLEKSGVSKEDMPSTLSIQFDVPIGTVMSYEKADQIIGELKEITKEPF